LAHRTDWSVFQEQFDTQLKFLHETIRATKPLMETAESGARVIVLSTEFVLGAPPQKIAPYVAAKAALTTYARVAAQELIKQGIRVHILAPGMVESALTADMPAEYLAEVAAAMPEKRLTSAMDVADVAQFLFTPAADSMYGTVIPVSRADRR
jgi:3-oxoacyl-[acyl-carrier protein] reductase